MFNSVEQLLRRRVERLPTSHHTVHTKIAEDLGDAVAARHRHHSAGHGGQRGVVAGGGTNLGLALFVLFSDFFEQVGDSNLMRATTEQDWCFDCSADVVGVDVAVIQTVATNDHDRVADFSPFEFELARLGVIDFQ